MLVVGRLSAGSVGGGGRAAGLAAGAGGEGELPALSRSLTLRGGGR